ncbi:MAG: hypothetical protein Q9195_009191 [Heterodermia aff. obscurata]
MEAQLQAPTPLLGSSLHSAALSRVIHIPERLSSGSASIDDQALEGGFRYGEITSIAGAHGTGKTTVPQLAFHAIASYLLSSPKGEVAFIDTSSTFSPVRLRDVLALRLRVQRQRTTFQQSGYVYTKQPAGSEPVAEELVEEATSMLDRVKLMRVFDVAGLVEAVGEITESCEQVAEFSFETKDLRRGVVADSQDDLSEDAGSETGERAERLASQNKGTEPTQSGKICTIISNAVVGHVSSKNQLYQQKPEENASIFYSITGKPALGKSFTYLIDTSIMLSALPKTAEDAGSAYGDNIKGRKPQYCGILEILHDKNGTRAENWVAFEMVDGLELMSISDGRS